MGWYILLALIVIALFVVSSAFTLVTQANRFVIERLGGYHVTLDQGLHFIIPFFDRVKKKISIKEQVVDFPPQPVITKDNVTMQIDTVVFYMVTDPKLYTYGVEWPLRAIENLAATTLRNIIGDLELDQSLTSRDLINTTMRNILDEATDPWGIKIIRVEVKNIIPPKDIREAMVEKDLRFLLQKVKNNQQYYAQKQKNKYVYLKLKVEHKLFFQFNQQLLKVFN